MIYVDAVGCNPCRFNIDCTHVITSSGATERWCTKLWW